MSQAIQFRFWAIPGLLFGAATWGLIWYPYRLLQDAGAGAIVFAAVMEEMYAAPSSAA